MCKEIDDKLLNMLHEVFFMSRLKTSLNIRLADYAAQQLGYRSIRQANNKEEISKIYEELMNKLNYVLNQCIYLLSDVHKYKQSILSLNDNDLEIFLEDTLFTIIVHEDINVFKEQFFDD